MGQLAKSFNKLGHKMKQYDITVKIRITVEDGNGMEAQYWASNIANDYAKMALQYKSIGADEVMRVDVEAV